jgi:SAM-dependent methyltransferase
MPPPSFRRTVGDERLADACGDQHAARGRIDPHDDQLGAENVTCANARTRYWLDLIVAATIPCFIKWPIGGAMSFDGHLDEVGEFVLHGWAHYSEVPELALTVDIVINGRLAGRARARDFRADLQLAGIGDGRKAFWFNPFEYLTKSENVVETFISGTDHPLWNGRQVIKTGRFAEHKGTIDVKSGAEARWTGKESDASLTWGSIMTGDTFIDQVERLSSFGPFQRILEIGPGYGRLLATLLQRGRRFREFVGLDLSVSRVDQLTARFGDSTVRFSVGNIDSHMSDGFFDLVISSATFEHIFPSVRSSLQNIHTALTQQGMAFIDFISADEHLSMSRAYFESEAGGAFIRVYSRDELLAFFAAAGFEVVEIIHPLLLGMDIAGVAVKRALVVAIKR